ncbi:MAG: preprotein translocase subunit YajC [Candidatus Tokpelaia sp.]|uniref:preprotein translocase subunit YajC n=1 Tax=Candidatus Tokpelaia sp. TaxID=2233777 RepID=UPI0012388E51|nr:MAG: preprotein translocase subunit YajC [Candidatus Tokpelaia sp.]KAA6207771.1 MAG: preprotein translocase subunit YajC [Candidatus Tokpelaia sp.]KAA6404946.1 preprotein translocase subunit YajC [Candidatus Tokpelaia sp.]
MSFIAPAYAAAGGGLPEGVGMFIPLVLIFVIMYFLIIRPQRAQMAKHKAMVNAVRRGDIVVTSGGIVGKVSKVYDDNGEIDVEIAENVRVRIIRGTLSAVRSKGETAESAKA